MLDYTFLDTMDCVLREGSFERAARSLGMTPSAVSQRIRTLEERMGAVLIVREHPCRATELGATLARHLARVRLLESDLGEAIATTKPSLRVAVNADSLATWFPDVLGRMAAQADVTFDLVLEHEAITADLLRRGEVLAAVTAESTPVPGHRTLSLGALVYTACATPDFAERHAADIALAPSLRFDRSDDLQARWLASMGLAPQGPTHWVPSTTGFLDLALQGIGWGLQPLSLAAPHLESGRLVELKRGCHIAVPLYWVTPRLQAGLLDRLTAAVRETAENLLQTP